MAERVVPKQIIADPETIADLMNAYCFAIFYNVVKFYMDKENQ